MTQATLPTSSVIRRRPRGGDSPQWLADSPGCSDSVRFIARSDVSPRLAAAALFLFAAGSVVSLVAGDAGLWLSLTGLAGAAALMLAVSPSRHVQPELSAQLLPTHLGPYTLLEKLGEGGMGVVYKARHRLLERPTAIKVLRQSRDPEAVRGFEREVQLTSKLTHPNTISIYDFGRTPDGACYYAMEYVDGVDLQTLVERDGPQAPTRVARLLAQVCGALSEAHEAGLIHRDIKPENLMLCQRGSEQDVLKVLDFGMITRFRDELGSPMKSDVQSVVGTPLYLSPEAVIAPENMDGRSDLYAVGVVGYFLLTGELPFSGSGLLEVCAHHLHTIPVPPSQRLGRRIPAALEALVLRCLEKAKEDRPGSAAELRDALLEFAASEKRPPLSLRRAGQRGEGPIHSDGHETGDRFAARELRRAG